MATAKLIESGTGKEYRLTHRVTTLGRGDDNNITIRNRIVSKYHLEIRRGLTAYTVVDRGSTHGFYVNDKRVKDRATIKDGDRLRVLIIYAEPIDDASTQSGTFVAKQAIAKSKLDGAEENMQVACDFTFSLENPGFLYRLFNK